jgi:hypothetical protein
VFADLFPKLKKWMAKNTTEKYQHPKQKSLPMTAVTFSFSQFLAMSEPSHLPSLTEYCDLMKAPGTSCNEFCDVPQCSENY